MAVRLLLGNKFWYAKGGVETYLFNLIDQLPQYGYDVIPFAMKHPRNRASEYAEYFVDEVDYHATMTWREQVRAAGRMVHSSHAASRLAALLRDHRPDLAHVHNVYHQLSPSILPVLSRERIPVVMTLHDLKLACPNYKMRTGGEICERCIGGGYHHAVLNRCVRDSFAASALCAFELFVHRWRRLYENHVQQFIVPSRFYLRKMVEAGIPEAKLTWIPTFAEVENYEPHYGGDDYFVYVGRLAEEKGLLSLLEAVRGLSATLVIVGEGPARSTLEQIVERDGMSNVRVIGPKWGSELVDIIRRARFSVIPSEWYENCPRSCVESFACGTPVIGAAIGGIPEMITHGKTGLLFPPFSIKDLRGRIEYLFAHDDEAAEMGRAARLVAELEYSPAAHMLKLLTVYDAMLGTRAAAIA